MDTMPSERTLMSLPTEMVFEVFRHLSLRDLAQVQQTCRTFYNFLLVDRAFVHYNTVKFFELYYRKHVLAIYLYPYIHPYLSYRGPCLDSDGAMPALYPNGEDQTSGNTGFHIAAANGLVEVVEGFLRREQQGKMHFMAMDLTCAYNREAAACIYLKDSNRGARLVDLENDEPNTALHYISIIPEGTREEDVLRVARLLFRMGKSDFRRKGRAGNTVMCEAAQHNQDNMVRLIVEEVKHAMIQEALATGLAQDSPVSDRTLTAARARSTAPTAAVMLDTQQQHQVGNRVRERLTEYINLANDYSENAVILASRSSPAILKLLLQEGGDANSRRRGSPLIHIICSLFSLDRQDPDYLNQYHGERSQVAGRETHERSFYLSSYRNEHLEENVHKVKAFDDVLRSLIQYGADVHAVHEGTGMQPMHTAAFWGNTGALDILLNEAKIDPNREVNRQNNWLPIHYACDEGQLWSIYTLVKAGADVTSEYSGASASSSSRSADAMEVDGEEASVTRAIRHAPKPLDLLRVDAMKVKVLMLAESTKRPSA